MCVVCNIKKLNIMFMYHILGLSTNVAPAGAARVDSSGGAALFAARGATRGFADTISREHLGYAFTGSIFACH